MLTPKVVILGAGRPHRGVNPSALAFISGNQRVLDWVIDSFRILPSAEFHFVGGYRMEEIIHAFPELHFTHNPDWESSGPVGSLVSAPISDNDTVFVSYADIVFSSVVIGRLRQSSGDISLVMDTGWKNRYPRRSQEDLAHAEKISLINRKVAAIGKDIPPSEAHAEFVGVARFSGKAVAAILRLTETDPKLRAADFPSLITRLLHSGLSVEAIEADGEWAELNEPQDLASYVLRTKAETLEKIRPLLKKSRIEDQIHFSVAQWQSDRDRILAGVQEKFRHNSIVVRSSAKSEDTWGASMAGKFSSILGIPSHDADSIAEAVTSVIASYGDSSQDHLILIQKMIANVSSSGVALTRTLSHGSPYYVLNYDDSGSTSSVTSGISRSQKLILVHRNMPDTSALPHRIRTILAAVRELEDLLHYDNLDVEFCITEDEELVIFQVRRIAVAFDEQRALDSEVEDAIRSAESLIDLSSAPRAGLLGSHPLFGVMPDWNPAEIIGTKPRPLALSLYQSLITDETWARQRAEFGYRDVRPHPLLVCLAGHPYVDVRASLNSFLPASLSEPISSKLLNAQLERLAQNPHLHDKIEFEVSLTCWNFAVDQDLRRLYPNLLSHQESSELQERLKSITWSAVLGIDRHIDRINQLQAMQGPQAPGEFPLRAAERELWRCREMGTLAFAHLARCGFVAKSMLDSMVFRGILDPEELDRLLGSLSTVTREFQVDAQRVAAGALPFSDFVLRYGHLRPGTYEITSPCYSADPRRYLRHVLDSVGSDPENNEPPFNLPPQKLGAIDGILSEAGAPFNAERLLTFAKTAIAGRERSKFIFTKNLSAAIEHLADFGATFDITREDLSWIRLNTLLDLLWISPPKGIREYLQQHSARGSSEHRITEAVELPALIFNKQHCRFFARTGSEPNYVTRKRACGDVMDIRRIKDPDDLRGKIAIIEQADPGYDWIFGCGIIGFVTMYGGANSHMTIRAAELGIPSAIGTGEALFETIAGARRISLDCEKRAIEVLP